MFAAVLSIGVIACSEGGESTEFAPGADLTPVSGSGGLSNDSVTGGASPIDEIPAGTGGATPDGTGGATEPVDELCDGIQDSSGKVCCPAACGECGGDACGAREGGGDACCTGRILESGSLCSDASAPCILGDAGTPSPPDDGLVRPPAGRLALVLDGNSPDPDDIGATSVMFGLLAATGLSDRLVHLSHSCDLEPSFIGESDARHKISRQDEKRRQEVLQQLCADGIDFFGPFSQLDDFYNNRTKQSASVADLTQAIDASTASDPLWIIEAGEPDIIGYALEDAKPSKRAFVHVVSHHPANDNSGDFFTWKQILDFGVDEHQIGDQNVGLQTPISPWDWAKDHDEPGIAWIWDRLAYAEADGVVKFQDDKFDCSDAGMVYWWITGANDGGNKLAEPADIRQMLLR